MSIERYKIYRQSLFEMQTRAAEWAMKQGNLFERVGRKLRMVAPDGTFIFEGMEDIDLICDAMLYETTIGGIKTISAYFKENPPLNDLEIEILPAMTKARFGLYRVESTNPINAEIRLRGLVAEAQDITLSNLALSETASPGIVLATRILSLPDLNMSTGAGLPFDASQEKRLVREWWSKQGLERIALFLKRHRRSGILIEHV